MSQFTSTSKYKATHNKQKQKGQKIAHNQQRAVNKDYIGCVVLDLTNITPGKLVDVHLPIENPKKKDKAGHSFGALHFKYQLLEREEVDKAFWFSFCKHFDTDGNGAINRIEFGAMIGAIHPTLTEPQITEMFDKADKNKDGEISFDEAYVMFTTDTRLTAAVLGDDPNFVWHIYQQSDDFHSVADLVLNKNLVHASPVAVDKADRKVIMVHHLDTKKLIEEKIPHYIEVSLRIMYSTSSGRTAVENSQIKKLLHHLSVVQGKKYDDPRSKKEIKSFIDFHGLNLDEILEPLDSFKNFNEFFYRKLKPTARPIDHPENPKVAVSPADCRLLVFPTIDDATAIWIKGKNFSLKNLVGDEALANKYRNGSMGIARLAPQDYHRFHLPVDCKIGATKHFDGALYTVNPIAIRENVDVYTENKRDLTFLENTAFGTVLFIAVGATMVGSINLTTSLGEVHKKGDEHGYFAFGGSTILLLFEPNKIVFKKSLLINSCKPIETLVKMGNKIGEMKDEPKKH
eukprot:Phypoly_transcript_06091.p1 GENE.Phypoly_transcript_06091~~Phypoly_transcript_06091.p1  ORF type:complete len:515 (+),score=90.29 Phypoly_transcript_06091:274-1818(+)